MSAAARTLLVASKGWAPDGVTADVSCPGGLLSFGRDLGSGLLGDIRGVTAVGAPSYLAHNAALSAVYVTSDFSNEAWQGTGGPRPGRVTAFRALPSGDLELLNDQALEGSVPCHVAVHQGGRHVLSADYGDGSITVHPVGEDGCLEPASDVFRNEGRGPDGRRQAGSHAHMVRPVRDSEWVLSTDIGTDEVIAHTLDLDSGRLRRRPGASARARPASGPRHLVVHPSGRIFVVNEYRSTVSVFSFDPATAKMDEIAEVSTTGGDVDDGNVPSGLVLSPDMQWLYVGNRGRDSIAVLRIDDAGLSWAGEVAAGGEPRDLAFVGGHLYVANLMSGTVSVFGWQPGSGSLGLPLQIVEVPSPSCVIGL